MRHPNRAGACRLDSALHSVLAQTPRHPVVGVGDPGGLPRHSVAGVVDPGRLLDHTDFIHSFYPQLITDFCDRLLVRPVPAYRLSIILPFLLSLIPLPNHTYGDNPFLGHRRRLHGCAYWPAKRPYWRRCCSWTHPWPHWLACCRARP